jgi:hypothetical protein
MQSLLDPSRAVVLVAHGSEAGTLDPALTEAVSGGSGVMTVMELAPPTVQADQARYEADLGLRSSVFLVRPDGYIGFAASANSAASQLEAWRNEWLSA